MTRQHHLKLQRLGKRAFEHLPIFTPGIEQTGAFQAFQNERHPPGSKTFYGGYPVITLAFPAFVGDKYRPKAVRLELACSGTKPS